MDGLNSNANHMAFKEPLPKYDKGESSKPKNGKVEINYTYMNAENVVNMLELVEENVNMMRNKDPYGYNLDMDSPPIFDDKFILVLRGPHSKVSSQSLKVVTQSQGPLVIRGPNSSQPSKPKQVASKILPQNL